MKILLIIFAIIFIILKLLKNYLENNLQANIKYHIKGGSPCIGILVISEYILGAVIIIKIIMKIVGE